MAASPLAHGQGLARVTVVASRRRVDVAVPDHVPVADLLGRLLAHTAEGTADNGEEHGGWALHRVDGTPVATDQTLAGQRVLDGEVLYLRPRHPTWPEPDFDDVVDAIAVGARAYLPTWTSRATRMTGLVLAAILLAAGLVPVLATGPPWRGQPAAALALALLLILAGALLSRALADAVAGAVVGAAGLAYAAVGGALLFLGDLPVTDLGTPHLLVGSTALVLAGLAGLVGIGGLARVFVAGITTGVFGAAAAIAGLASLQPTGVAGAALTLGVLAVPALPLLATRMARVPVPRLPETATELLVDEPSPDVAAVFVAVARTDELLTGMITGTALAAVVSEAVLVRHAGVASVALAVAGGTGLLLRTRTFLTVRQRVPLLAAGVAGPLVLACAAVIALDPGQRLVVALVGSVLAAATAAGAGLAYSRHPPTPYLGRVAEILDAVAIIAMVPLLCSIVGLFGYARGFFG
jgi:type VII secretion integral membrane protein EccD